MFSLESFLLQQEVHVSSNCLGLTGTLSIGRTRNTKSEIGHAKWVSRIDLRLMRRAQSTTSTVSSKTKPAIDISAILNRHRVVTVLRSCDSCFSLPEPIYRLPTSSLATLLGATSSATSMNSSWNPLYGGSTEGQRGRQGKSFKTPDSPGAGGS